MGAAEHLDRVGDIGFCQAGPQFRNDIGRHRLIMLGERIVKLAFYLRQQQMG